MSDKSQLSVYDKCTQAGVRLTNHRRVIIDLIGEAHDHPDVDTIYRRANAIDKTISLATVYRTVSVLEQADLIEKVDIGDGKARYEMARGHHEHLVDIDSGEIHEFYHPELEGLKRKIARDMGFELVDHHLEMFGRKLKPKGANA